jgi:hypothetical protein
MASDAQPAPPAQPAKPYEIVGAPVHVNRFDESTQKVVSGWSVQARWLANGSVIESFVPDGSDLAATADADIRYQGEQLDTLHAMGA